MRCNPDKPPIHDYEFIPAPNPRAKGRLVLWTLCTSLLLVGIPAIALVSARSSWLVLIIGWPILGAIAAMLPVVLATAPTDAVLISRRTSRWVIVLGAAFLSGAVLVTFQPLLSDDMLRYRVDGRMISNGLSPWSTAPITWQYSRDYPIHSADNWWLDAITPYPELRTIYPPVAQAWFGAVDLIGRSMAAGPWPDSPATAIALGPKGVQSGSVHALLFRSGAAAYVLICTGVLLAILAELDRSPWYAALFAWNPLTIIETAGQGHVDIMGATFVLLAILAAMRGRWLLSAILLALAAGVKPHAALLAPAMILSLAGRRERLGGIVAFGIGLLVVYAPILLFPGNLRGWMETAQVYSVSWECNGSVYELITAPFRDGNGQSLESAKMLARLLAGVGTILTLYLCLRNRLPVADAGYWLVLVPLLLAPVVYPWYLLWGLALVPLLQRTGGWTMLAWAATSGLSYQILREPVWHLPATWAAAEYVPVYAALAFELRRLVATPTRGGAAPAP